MKTAACAWSSGVHGRVADLPQTTQSQLLAIDFGICQGAISGSRTVHAAAAARPRRATPQERARVNLTAGYALIMQGREQEAKEYFARALDAEPNIVLDPVQVSPKFRVVFDEVKGRSSSRHSAEQTGTFVARKRAVRSAS